ncbi:glycosyltransferase [Nitritalea halalkaliphila]|nr:glycosyltransferase [Nitritalea halalkaliphila]
MRSLEQLRQLPIVMLSMSRWDSPISSASWSLAQEFAKQQPVYYVDYPYTFRDFQREKGQPELAHRQAALSRGEQVLREVGDAALGGRLKALTPPLMWPVNWLPPGPLYRFAQRRNDRVLANSIQAALASEGHKSFILWNSFNPIYLSTFKEFLQPALSVYHSRDAIGAINAYTRKHGVAAELAAIRGDYAISLASSGALAQDLSARAGREVHVFANGGNTELFAKAWREDLPCPSALAGLPRPIIGYTGNVCQRQDYALLEKIARRFPKASLVFVGPREDHLHTSIRLADYPNVHFVGPRQLAELPAYLKQMDCALIPFEKTALTAGIYPLKINEYLAAGRAVVSTNFSVDIAGFADAIYLAEDHEAFLEALPKAIADQSPEAIQARYARASQNSWTARVAHFWSLIDTLFYR